MYAVTRDSLHGALQRFRQAMPSQSSVDVFNYWRMYASIDRKGQQRVMLMGSDIDLYIVRQLDGSANGDGPVLLPRRLEALLPELETEQVMIMPETVYERTGRYTEGRLEHEIAVSGHRTVVESNNFSATFIVPDEQDFPSTPDDIQYTGHVMVKSAFLSKLSTLGNRMKKDRNDRRRLFFVRVTPGKTEFARHNGIELLYLSQENEYKGAEMEFTCQYPLLDFLRRETVPEEIALYFGQDARYAEVRYEDTQILTRCEHPGEYTTERFPRMAAWTDDTPLLSTITVHRKDFHRAAKRVKAVFQTEETPWIRVEFHESHVTVRPVCRDHRLDTSFTLPVEIQGMDVGSVDVSWKSLDNFLRVHARQLVTFELRHDGSVFREGAAPNQRQTPGAFCIRDDGMVYLSAVSRVIPNEILAVEVETTASVAGDSIEENEESETTEAVEVAEEESEEDNEDQNSPVSQKQENMASGRQKILGTVLSFDPLKIEYTMWQKQTRLALGVLTQQDGCVFHVAIRLEDGTCLTDDFETATHGQFAIWDCFRQYQ